MSVCSDSSRLPDGRKYMNEYMALYRMGAVRVEHLRVTLLALMFLFDTFTFKTID